VLAALGYSWEELHRRFPRLIVASLSGFGQHGPYANRKAVDTIIQGMSGFISTTGLPEQAVKVGTTISDLLAGVYCATGVLAALQLRHSTQEGSRVDVAMFDTSFAMHAREFANYHLRKCEPLRLGNTSPIGVYPFDVFECRDGKLFSIEAASDSKFASFCSLLGAPALAEDKAFATAEGRWANMEVLRARLTERTKRWDREALLDKLLSLRGSESFPVGPVNTMQDLSVDPQLAHRSMLQTTEDGRFVVLGNPIKITSHGVGAPESNTVPNPPEYDANASRIRVEFMSKL